MSTSTILILWFFGGNLAAIHQVTPHFYDVESCETVGKVWVESIKKQTWMGPANYGFTCLPRRGVS